MIKTKKLLNNHNNLRPKALNRCSRCALPDTFPGVMFNKSNVCNYCLYHDLNKTREHAIRATLKNEFVDMIEGIKRNRKGSKYDCVVAFSGGKDSTFLLSYLKEEFGLKILAHTLDNSFVSQRALDNIEIVINKLGIDHKFTRPDFSMVKEIFVYALEGRFSYPKEIVAMMSPVCAACLGMVFGTTINLAVELEIPLMFVGFTPGQYPAVSLENFFKVKSCVFLSEQVYKDDPLDVLKIIRDPIEEKFGEVVEKLYFKSQYIPKGLKVPSILFPFHALLDYDEKYIFDKISKLGWVKPKDTDSCSTNCLLNTLGNYSCEKQLGYHPYAGELSLLLREGKLSHQEVLAAQEVLEDSFAMQHSLCKLELHKEDLE